MNETLAVLVPALGTALLHFLWQGALVGLTAWLALALLRNSRPQTRYTVACLALLACVLLPAWTLAEALSGTSFMPAGGLALVAGDLAAAPAEPSYALRVLPAPSMGYLPWLVALWAAGVVTLALRMACGWLWVRRLCRAAHADIDGRWQACADRLAPKLGIVRKVAVHLVDGGDGPVTAGWWRPVVLLPMAVAARMPADLVEALIAHELAHIRRHDYVVNLLQGAAEALLFYHPVVWLLSRRIRIERELVADDLAVSALGEPRRLALALSQLDRHIAAQAPLPQPRYPQPHYAPAAHGGHLMSRIQHLVRPERRAIGGSGMLPLLGLALAGAAFYAHAHLAPTTGAAQATPAPAATTQALPVPEAKPGVQVLPAPTAAPRAQTATAATTGDRDGYALVLEDHDGYAMSGDMDDRHEIDAARRAVDGDFLWFRRDGKAWVVRDAETIARARAASVRIGAMGERMEALQARMEPHSERMEALAERMAALHVDNAFESPETRAAIARMEALGERMGPLAEREAALAMRMHEASEADLSQLEREREELERKREALHREMQQHGATLKALHARMESQREPMEALSREMKAASEPMKDIGREMEAMGARIRREAELADGQVQQLIDEAYRNGQAQPAPVQQ